LGTAKLPKAGSEKVREGNHCKEFQVWMLKFWVQLLKLICIGFVLPAIAAAVASST